MCIVFFLSLCFSGNLAALPSAAVSDHLIPLPAVNFASSSPQTASVRLSQREYERETKSLKELCDIKYQKLLRSLNKEEKELLSAIAHGDKETSQRLLNEILGHILFG